MALPHKAKTTTTLRPSNPTAGYTLEPVRHLHPHVQCKAIYINRNLEATKCPFTDQWIKAVWSRHVVEYYSALRKVTALSSAATRTDVEVTGFAETSSHRGRRTHAVSLWSLKVVISQEVNCDGGDRGQGGMGASRDE